MKERKQDIEIRPLKGQEADGLIAASTAYMERLYPAESNHLTGLEELMGDSGYFLGAFTQQQAVGCAALLFHNTRPPYAEIKRLFVLDDWRGKGIAKRLMQELEDHARSLGYIILRLETGIYQPESIALYQRMGYERIDPFGDYPDDPLSLYMEKQLAS